MTKLNTGLSGCSLELINDRILRKYSPTTDYNSRLLSQADKQVVFGNRIYKNIDAPMYKNRFRGICCKKFSIFNYSINHK